MVFSVKRIAKRYNSSFFDFINHTLKGYAKILGLNEFEIYRLLLGESN